MVRQCEQDDTLGYFVLTQFSRSSHRWMFKQVPDVMRLSPYLYFMLPVNESLMLKIQLGLNALLKIAGTIIAQARLCSRKGMINLWLQSQSVLPS